MTISLDDQIMFIKAKLRLRLDDIFDMSVDQWTAILASLRLLKKIREGTQLLLGAIIFVVLLMGFREAVSVLVSP